MLKLKLVSMLEPFEESEDIMLESKLAQKPLRLLLRLGMSP